MTVSPFAQLRAEAGLLESCAPLSDRLLRQTPAARSERQTRDFRADERIFARRVQAVRASTAPEAYSAIVDKALGVCQCRCTCETRSAQAIESGMPVHLQVVVPELHDMREGQPVPGAPPREETEAKNPEERKENERRWFRLAAASQAAAAATENASRCEPGNDAAHDRCGSDARTNTTRGSCRQEGRRRSVRRSSRFLARRNWHLEESGRTRRSVPRAGSCALANASRGTFKHTFVQRSLLAGTVARLPYTCCLINKIGRHARRNGSENPRQFRRHARSCFRQQQRTTAASTCTETECERCGASIRRYCHLTLPARILVLGSQGQSELQASVQSTVVSFPAFYCCIFLVNSISAWRLVDPRLLPKMPETQLVWWQHPPLKKPPHLWLQWPLLPSVGERDNCSCRHTESHQKRPHKPRAKFRHYTDPASDLNKATDLSVMEQLVCAEAATLQTAQPLLKQHASLLPFTQYPLLKESDKDKFERTQYQRELRQESILVLSNANPRQRQLFDELAFDISARVHEVSHDAQFSADRVSAARALLRLGKKVKVARDEIYAQLVVHTINNPSQSSRRALWITVFLALSTFPPSPPMRAFMMSEAAAQSDKFLWHRDPHSPGSAAGLAFLALKFGHAANPKIAAISTKATRAAFAVCAQKLSLLLHVQGGDMAVSVDARMSDSLHEVARKAAFALGLETGGEGVAMCDRMRVSIETDFALLTRLLKQWTGRATVFHVVHMINLARAKRPFLRVKWRLALWHWGMLDDLPSVDLRMLHLMYGTAYDEWRRGEWSAVSPEASEQLATFALLISTNGAPSGAQNRLTPTYLASMLPRSMCGDVRRLTRVLLRRIRAVHIAVAPTDVSKANESEEEQSVLPPGQRFRVSSLMNRFLSIAKESEDFGWTRFAARTSDLVVISLHTKRGVRVHRLLSDGTVAQQLGAAPSVNALGNVTVNDDKSVVVRECALLDTDVMLIRCPRTFAAVVGDFQQRG
ncbi:MAG: hypothetical protein MHM6MM_003557 [Cercozoa sp. M6MM]